MESYTGDTSKGSESSYTLADRERMITESPKSLLRTEFERDRARILHSAALRRLGAKTQVLTPISDGDIRTRLSHSLEVAQVGRTLAHLLGADPDIVDSACLAHDLGHPPFGHNGERALNEAAAGIGGFEGNAQTLRIVTRLEPKVVAPDGAPAGLNLTRATLDACCKYPWQRAKVGRHARKFGVYDDDAEVFKWLRAPAPQAQRRCIEAQIMDLSDDIAYSVHDVEDGIRIGRIDPAVLTDETQLGKIIQLTFNWYGDTYSADELADAAHGLVNDGLWLREYTGSYRDLAALKQMTSRLIGDFCSSVHAATRAEAGTAPLSRYAADLVIPRETAARIVLLKGVAACFVMEPRELDHAYLQERTVLFDLVDRLLELGEDGLEEPFKQFYREADGDGRFRVIIDQVASLTDIGANQWHARLCGMFTHL